MDELEVRPFERLTVETAPSRWLCYVPPESGRKKYWFALCPVKLTLPGVPFLTAYGDKWWTEPGAIHIEMCWRTDGASGPAFDDEEALLAACAHDVACTRIALPDGTVTHALPGYFRRHALYARILRAQGEPRIRCAYSWLGLVAANWFLELWKAKE